MNANEIHHAVGQWVRLGAMFNIPPVNGTVDVERLLLDTARCAPSNARLFILAVTWLTCYGEYVARHRLARMILHELEAEHRPVMGLMLDLAREKNARNSHRFNQAIAACGGVRDHRPLLDIDRRNGFFSRAARQNASVLSLKWGRWMEVFALKENAIRPAKWIIQTNPDLQWRADFAGDLRASILAELQANPRAGDSESELARACGVTRAAIIAALAKLEQAGRITRQRQQNRLAVRQNLRAAAA